MQWRQLMIFAIVSTMIIASTATAHADTSVADLEVPAVVEDGLDHDAIQYATEYGVNLKEAKQRLELQDAAGKLGTVLEAKESDTFGGAWIEHEPEFKIVILFTRDGTETTGSYAESSPLDDVIEVRSASVTLAHLVQLQQHSIDLAQTLDVSFESSIDVRRQQVELYVVDREQFDQAMQAAQFRMPERVAVVTVASLSTESANIYGGLATTPCTSGFAVKSSSGTRGITTAGHCGGTGNSNPITYGGASLPLQGEWYGGAYDLQWHSVPSFTLRSWMQVNSSGTYRNVSGIKSRTDQVVGEYVCKYGKTTGYGCGNIETKYYQPAIPNSTATFIRVHNSSGIDLSEGGDSGGPWFNGNTAFGMMYGSVGGTTGIDGIYMAVNYLANVGLQIQLNCPGSGC